MNKHWLILLLVCGTALARAPANESEFYAGSAERSLALNIALATNLTDLIDGPLTDVPRAQLARGLGDDPAVLAHFLEDNNLGTLQVAPLVKPTHLPHPALKPQLIAWMPQSEAATPAEAQPRMSQLLLAAYRRAATEDMGWEPYTEKLGRNKLLLYRGGAGLCGDIYRCEIVSFVGAPEYSSRTPDFIGPPSSSYLWRNWELMQDTTQMVLAEVYMTVRNSDWTKGGRLDLPKKELGWDRRQMALLASKYLPDWVYFYEPPDAAHRYPCMLHGGKEILFVQPLTAAAPASAPAATDPAKSPGKKKKRRRTP